MHDANIVASGTLGCCELAPPDVANLAAKLIALDPSLPPVQVIELIKQGATASEDGRLHLIDAKASVTLLKANR